MRHNPFRRTAGLALLAVTALTGAACDSDPFDIDDHEDAVGVAITDLQDNLIAEAHGDHWDFEVGDALALTAGEELEVMIWFLDENDQRFQIEADDMEYSLRVTVADEDVASYESHGDHGDFVGVAEGETTAVISLFHGSHSDFDAPALPITVTAADVQS